MDAISYAHSAKQEQRIKKFINDPDSTSGIITVPKVIASGENITVPAGRMAVLPNVQVDGTLNVQGDVFIPSGTTMSKVVEKVTSTDNAIVRFDGTTGKVQNSGVIIDDNNNVGIGVGNPSSSLTVKDGITLVRQFNNATARPNVTPGVQKYGVHVGTDNYDDGFLRLSAGGGAGNAKSYIDLSGYSTVPDMNMNIVFGTSNTERMRIDANGNVGIGTSSPVAKLSINSTTGNEAIRIGNSAGGSGSVQGSTYIGLTHWSVSDSYFSSALIGVIEDGDSSYNASMIFSTRGASTDTLATERMRIDSNGRVGIGVTPSNWASSIKMIDLGQGTAIGNLGSYVTSAFAANCYYNAGWKYKNNEVASLYEQQGLHKWYIAPSGTAGNAITWTNAMTLTSSGNLLVGTSTDNGVDKLQVN